METIIAYVPESAAKSQINVMADEVAEACEKICGREKNTVPVMIHEMGSADGNECGTNTAAFYVYANAKYEEESRKKLGEEICRIAGKYYPQVKPENQIVIFKLHENEDMGINGKLEGQEL